MQLQKVKLLHLLKSLELGGIEKSTIIYSNNLAERLCYVAIFSRGGRYTKTNMISDKIHLYNKIHGTIGVNKYFFSNLFYLISIIHNERINIIFYHYRIYLPFVLIIKLLFPRLKIVYVAHSSFNDMINRFLYAKKYIAVSEIVMKDLLEYRKSDITLIKHGIKVDSNSQNRAFEIKNIGFIGRFEKGKGIEILLKAFDQMAGDNKNLRLIFRGEGNEKDSIQSFTLLNNLQERIIIEEPILCQDKLYSEIDILVFPSNSLEGFGMVILEAMKYRIPVIASDYLRGINLIDENHSGIFFKNGDHIDLASKLKLLIEDRELRLKISGNAFEKLKKDMNLDDTISKYLEFIDYL